MRDIQGSLMTRIYMMIKFNKGNLINGQNLFDVFLTSEDVLMYIIIVCCFTPIRDVFMSLWDVLIVSIY